MASIQDAIVALLEADETVAATAPGGLFPDVLSPAASLPALRYLTVDEVPVMASDGRTGTHRVRMQVDAFAYTRDAADSAADAVLAALCPQPNVRRSAAGFVIDGVVPELARNDFEQTTELYVRSWDFLVWGGAA